MGDFRTYQNRKRVPAKPMEPLIDPAAWMPDDVRNVDEWSYSLTDSDIGELLVAIKSAKQKGIPLVDIRKADFNLDGLAAILADMRLELLDGKGMILLKRFPVEQLSREEQAIGYLGLGSHLGTRVPQNAQGHVLGHVKDLGGDRNDPHTRGYVTRESMEFHTDSTDFVGLLCLQAAKSGGESRISNSVMVYNKLLAERPELAKALIADFYYTLHGETNPGEPAWYKQPVFAFVDGYFSACGFSNYVMKAQGLPGVPPLTPEQLEALPVYRRIVRECSFDMKFDQGDIQFLNNHVLMHSRRSYEDWPEESRKRHLLRLWLNDLVGRPIPEYRRKGRHAGGVLLKGVQVNAPLDVHALA